MLYGVLLMAGQPWFTFQPYVREMKKILSALIYIQPYVKQMKKNSIQIIDDPDQWHNCDTDPRRDPISKWKKDFLTNRLAKPGSRKISCSRSFPALESDIRLYAKF